MNFTEIKLKIAEEAGLDPTTHDTKLGVWANSAYLYIAGMFNWPWLMKSGIVQTVTDIETGTATIAAGGTALTFSSGPAVSVAADYMIQFDEESDDWYEISAHTAGETTATISPAFVGSSAYTAGSYICRKIRYSLASDADKIISMKQAITDQPIDVQDLRTMNRVLPDPTETGSPDTATLLGLDSNNYWQIQFYPIPDDIINIFYQYYQKVAALTGTDTPIMPVQWHPSIVFVALATFGHAYMDDDRIQSAVFRAKEILTTMVRQFSPTPNKLAVMQAWDQDFTRPRYNKNTDTGYEA